MHNPLAWERLTPDVARALEIGTPVLIVRGDGKGHYGKFRYMTRDYIELQNGRHSQMVPFYGPASYIITVELPVRPLPTMAHPRLNLEQSDG